MTRILYVISQVDKSLGFEWLANEIRKPNLHISFVLLHRQGSPLQQHLESLGYVVTCFTYLSRKDRLRCFLSLLKYFRKVKPDIVHVHLVEAGLTAIPAAWLAGVPKRIYTRHHASYHHEYHPSFVKFDKMINRLSTHLVAISENVKNVLVKDEGVDPRKITVIYHGFRLDYFQQPLHVQKLKAEYNPSGKSPVIGVISRYQHLKGIQYIIPAFQEILKTHPDALLLLANAKGEYLREIKAMLSALPAGSYREIEFEADVVSLYGLMDVFLHVPVNAKCEAFGQIYVEALAAGIPSVFTLSGVAPEFIVNGENALVVPYCREAAITKAVLLLLDDPALRTRLIENGRKAVHEKFDLAVMIKSLRTLYES